MNGFWQRPCLTGIPISFILRLSNKYQQSKAQNSSGFEFAHWKKKFNWFVRKRKVRKILRSVTIC